MPQGYLVLACERRVLTIMFDDDAIHQTIGYQTIVHGTTCVSEDQLLIKGGELGDIATPRFYFIRGLPFPFAGNALLVGIEPIDWSIADRPVMAIGEFRLMISFVTPAEVAPPIAATDADRRSEACELWPPTVGTMTLVGADTARTGIVPVLAASGRSLTVA